MSRGLKIALGVIGVAGLAAAGWMVWRRRGATVQPPLEVRGPLNPQAVMVANGPVDGTSTAPLVSSADYRAKTSKATIVQFNKPVDPPSFSEMGGDAWAANNS